MQRSRSRSTSAARPTFPDATPRSARRSFAVPLIASLALSVGFAACTDDPGPAATVTVEPTAARTSLVPGSTTTTIPSTSSPTPLPPGVYLAQSVEGITVPRGVEIRIELRDDATISASAGCNIASGAFSVSGRRLIVSGLFMTEIGCDPVLMELDAALWALLSNGPRVSVEGGTLTLSTADAQLVFQRDEMPEATTTTTTTLPEG